MILLFRERTENHIHHNFFGEVKAEFERELLDQQMDRLRGKVEKHKFLSARWKEAKVQLIAETAGKCAYCEAPTALVAYGDVEHYRPKSKYWWLAYCYDNFLVSCQLCNQQFKKAHFPVRGDRLSEPVPPLDPTRDPLAPNPLDVIEVERFIMGQFDEQPLLINPYYDDPSIYFAWHADAVLEEVELIQSDEHPDSAEVVQAAVDFYGLNRKFLRDARWDRYIVYKTFRDVLSDEGINAATKMLVENQIKEMKSLQAPFAGMIRFFDADRVG